MLLISCAEWEASTPIMQSPRRDKWESKVISKVDEWVACMLVCPLAVNANFTCVLFSIVEYLVGGVQIV